MIYIVAYLAIAILGISAITKGKISLSRKQQILGPPARAIGVIALLAYPIAWVIGFCYGLYWISYHPNDEIPVSASLIVNLGAFAIVGLAIALVAVSAKKEPRES